MAHRSEGPHHAGTDQHGQHEEALSCEIELSLGHVPERWGRDPGRGRNGSEIHAKRNRRRAQQGDGEAHAGPFAGEEGRPLGDQQRRGMGHQDQSGEIVGVHRGDTDHDVPNPVPPGGPLQLGHEEIAGQNDEKHQEPIGPGGLGKPKQECVGRKQQPREETAPPPEEPGAEEVHRGDAKGRKQRRQAAHRRLAVSEDPHPAGEQVVIQQHVGVEFPDRIEHPGWAGQSKLHARGLIEPEALPADPGKKDRQPDEKQHQGIAGRAHKG